MVGASSRNWKLSIESQGRKSKIKISDWERFREFVKQHGAKTQIEISKLWGEGVTQQNISDAMKKIGVSRKKRVMDIEKEMN